MEGEPPALSVPTRGEWRVRTAPAQERQEKLARAELGRLLAEPGGCQINQIAIAKRETAFHRGRYQIVGRANHPCQNGGGDGNRQEKKLRVLLGAQRSYRAGERR